MSRATTILERVEIGGQLNNSISVYQNYLVIYKMSDQFAVGIDLGTTYIQVCVYIQEGFRMKFHCERKMPSCAAYVERLNQWVVGEEAKRQAPENIENTLFSSKRMLGRSFESIVNLEEMKYRLFEIKDENGKAKITIKGMDHTIFPIEVVARILREAKIMTEQSLGHEVTKVVITVPACFNSDQREHTILAADIAGLEVLSVVNDTMAAAIIYMDFMKSKFCLKNNLLVVSMGGGSYDVSIVSKQGSKFEEKHIAGDKDLGGQDVDTKLAEYYCQKLDTNSNIEPGNKFRFRQECVKPAKEQLSQCDVSTFIAKHLDEDVIFTMTTERLETVLKSTKIISEIKNAIEAALQEYANDVSFVLIGGSTHMKCIRECLLPSGEKSVPSVGEYVVAGGAAYYAYSLLKELDPDIPSSKQPSDYSHCAALGPEYNEIEDLRSLLKEVKTTSNVQLGESTLSVGVSDMVSEMYIIKYIMVLLIKLIPISQQRTSGPDTQQNQQCKCTSYGKEL